MDKEALVKFNGFLAPKAEGSYLILNEGGYQIEGQTDTWKVIDEKNVQEQRFVQLVCESASVNTIHRSLISKILYTESILQCFL